MAQKVIIILSILSLAWSCQKINYYPDKIVAIANPKLIAHRGRIKPFEENTLMGIRAALKFADGVEIDVQISKDETIWLSHSEDVMDCDKVIKCFAETRDEVIEKVMVCNTNQPYYSKFEDVLKLAADSFPDKPLCIDLKGWFPCSGNSIDIDGMMRREAEIIINMASGFGLTKNLLFEIETTTVLDFIASKQSQAGTFLNSYGDLERAMLICLKQGYTGISYKTGVGEPLTKEKIDLLHRKGLKIIAWNVNEAIYRDELIAMGVDYVQFDF